MSCSASHEACLLWNPKIFTMPTKACYWTPFRTRWTQFTASHPTSLHPS